MFGTLTTRFVCLRPGRPRLVHELGISPAGVGIRVTKFRGFNPHVFSFKRAIRVPHRRVAAGRLRQMAGDNPDEGVTGASDDSSKRKWERFQVLHGTGHEYRARGRADSRSALSWRGTIRLRRSTGDRRCGREGIACGSCRLPAWRPCCGSGRSPGDDLGGFLPRRRHAARSPAGDSI